jgi:hypothetical protein
LQLPRWSLNEGRTAQSQRLQVIREGVGL